MNWNKNGNIIITLCSAVFGFPEGRMNNNTSPTGPKDQSRFILNNIVYDVTQCIIIHDVRRPNIPDPPQGPSSPSSD